MNLVCPLTGHSGKTFVFLSQWSQWCMRSQLGDPTSRMELGHMLVASVLSRMDLGVIGRDPREIVSGFSRYGCDLTSDTRPQQC